MVAQWFKVCKWVWKCGSMAVNVEFRLGKIPLFMSAPVRSGSFQVGNSALKCNNQSETVSDWASVGALISDTFGNINLWPEKTKRMVSSSILQYFTALFENNDHEFKCWQGKWFVLKQSSPDVFQRSWPEADISSQRKKEKHSFQSHTPGFLILTTCRCPQTLYSECADVLNALIKSATTTHVFLLSLPTWGSVVIQSAASLVSHMR